MDYVRNVLMDKKYFESIDEVEQLLQSSDVSQNSVIQKLIFSTQIFPSEDDARLYAREHGFIVEEVLVNFDNYTMVQLDASQFVDDTLKVLDVATGIQATVGVLKQDAVEGGLSEVYLSLRNDDSIKFNENLPHIIELAKVVQGVHAAYGKVQITNDMLESFARNFTEGVVGVDLMIDYDHEQRGAAGWVKSVFVSNDGMTLFGEVKWTPKGAKTLSDREFRYFSPEFTENYTHPHTGKPHGPTLLGGGLVNRPFLKMDAIVAFKETTNNEVKMETVALTEHNAIKSDLEKTVADFKLSEEKAKTVITGQKEEITKLSEKLETLETEKKENEVKAKNEKLFSENKISKAQLDALNEGKDMYEVLSLSEKMTIEPVGKDGAGTVIELSESDEKACKALGISKEDYAKYNL